MGTWNGGLGPMTIVERFDVQQQIAEDEKNLKNEFRGGLEFGCCLCGESYKAPKDVPIQEVRELQKWLAQGNCPYCKDGTLAYYKRLKASNMQFSNIPHEFFKDGKSYFVLRLGRK
jgi:hypothetical protein